MSRRRDKEETTVSVKRRIATLENRLGMGRPSDPFEMAAKIEFALTSPDVPESTKTRLAEILSRAKRRAERESATQGTFIRIADEPDQ